MAEREKHTKHSHNHEKRSLKRKIGGKLNPELYAVSSIVGSIPPLIPPVGLSIIDTVTGNFDFIPGDLALASYTLLVTGLVHGAEVTKDILTKTKIRERWHFSNDELGYDAQIYEYKGENPLTLYDGLQVNTAENILLLRLPEPIDGRQVTPKQKQLLEDLTSFAIEDAYQNAKPYSYKAVVLMPQPDVADPFAKEDLNVDAGRVVQNESARTTDTNVRVVSKDFFRQVAQQYASAPEDFFTALDALGDKAVAEEIEALAHMFDPDHIKAGNAMIQKRLNTVLAREIAKYDNGSHTVRERTTDYFDPVVTRVFGGTVKVIGEGEDRAVQRINSVGQIENQKLTAVLKDTDMTLDEILHMPSPMKKAYLANYISELLKKDPDIRQYFLDRNEVVDELKYEGIDLLEARPTKMLSTPDRNEQHHFVSRVAIPLLLSAWFGLVAFDKDPFDFRSHYPHHPRNFMQTSKKPLPSPGIQLSKVKFPNTVPQHGIEWELHGVGNIDTRGYYTIATSNDINSDGNWVENTSAPKNIQLPTKVNSNGPYITERKQLNTDTNKTVKLPIKDGTTLSAINVTNKNNLPVAFQAVEYEDGTVQLEFKESVGQVLVEVTLTPSQTPQVHADGVKIQKPDPNKLNSDVTRSIQNVAPGVPMNQLTPELIRQAIEESHLYSIDNQQGNDQLDRAKTPEEIINVIASLRTCDCEVCAEEQVLLTSYLSQNNKPDTQVNLAVGFFQGVDAQASGASTNYLLDEAAHAYGIDGTGKILDATPGNLASDKTTQDYINLLASTTGNTNALDTQWQANTGIPPQATTPATQTPLTPTPAVTPTPRPTETPTPQPTPIPTLPIITYTPTPAVTETPVPNHNTVRNTENDDRTKHALEIAIALVALATGGGIILSRQAIKLRAAMLEEQARKNNSSSVSSHEYANEGRYDFRPVEQVIEELVLSSFEQKDFEDAYEFLSYVSYGGEPRRKFRMNDHSWLRELYPTNEALLKSMRKHLIPERLQAYVESPHDAEKGLDLPMDKRWKIRALANYLS